jgi:hypothetical protein
MTGEEAAYEKSKWAEVEDDSGELFHNGHKFIGRWEPDRYHGEPEEDPALAKREAAAEETRVRRKIQRDSIFFGALSIDNLSCT